MTAPELRPYQHEAIDRIRDAIAAGYRRILLVVPTGGGKTIISAAMIAARSSEGDAACSLRTAAS
jgi:superfamily II DNA or RNA helicase